MIIGDVYVQLTIILVSIIMVLSMLILYIVWHTFRLKRQYESHQLDGNLQPHQQDISGDEDGDQNLWINQHRESVTTNDDNNMITDDSPISFVPKSDNVKIDEGRENGREQMLNHNTHIQLREQQQLHRNRTLVKQQQPVVLLSARIRKPSPPMLTTFSNINSSNNNRNQGRRMMFKSMKMGKSFPPPPAEMAANNNNGGTMFLPPPPSFTSSSTFPRSQIGGLRVIDASMSNELSEYCVPNC